MAMGKRAREGQASFWIATDELPRTPGHPFYERLNQIFEANGFDRFVEKRCGDAARRLVLAGRGFRFLRSCVAVSNAARV